MKKNLVVLPLALASAVANANDSFNYSIEIKGHYRDSDSNRFTVNFPFPPQALPIGETTAFQETVDAGQHFELSTITIAGLWKINLNSLLQFKLDTIDLYDRNPTRGDRKFDIDQLFYQYGSNPGALSMASEQGGYFKVGKFTKFERQNERRTESYGLVSTAFNRFEDSGIEAGFYFDSGLYAKASWTTGNPVFFRDPNALAGQNGTPENVELNADPNLKSGILVLYDAEIEKLDLGTDHDELGVGVGYKWQSQDQAQALEGLLFHYKRDLAETRELRGTFYGGDLDLFDLGDVPGAAGIKLPYEGNDKTESGVNLWYRNNDWSVFIQYVDQEMASLKRDGLEVELAYTFDMQGVKITPVVRVSSLDNSFVGSPLFPSPSVWWDWRKTDYAVNFDVNERTRLIVEYADNKFFRGGKWEENNELLVTLRWKFGN